MPCSVCARAEKLERQTDRSAGRRTRRCGLAKKHTREKVLAFVAGALSKPRERLL